MRWTPEIVAAVTRLWDAGLKKREIRTRLGLTRGQLAGATMRLNLHTRKTRPLVIPASHPAAIEGRSIYPAKPSAPHVPMLKSGRDTPKLGGEVLKGRWRGMRIFSLTLEERATCPRSCAHWLDCYGNHMPFAARQEHGEDFEIRLEDEIGETLHRHGDILIRLHVLGDFYSVAYARRWFGWMLEYDGLHVFGYTARRPDAGIGKIISEVRAELPEPWWVRFSDGPAGTLRTGDDGIVCPAQTGKSRSCATCGLCWTTTKPIKFLPH